MDQTRFALLVDLENTGARDSILNHIIEKVKMRGSILIARVYGYTDRHAELKEVLLSNTFTVVPALKHGHHQKNSMDIHLILDALEVAYTNPLIDSFCIVSGDSDFVPLVGKLKSMGKFVLGISRSEATSHTFINACNEFIFLESMSTPSRTQTPPPKSGGAREEPQAAGGEAELCKILERIVREQADESGYVFASELKNTLLRLRPDFNEKNYGFSSFGKLVYHLQERYSTLRVDVENFSLLVRLAGEEAAEGTAAPQITRDNWQDIFLSILNRYKEEDFDRVNPSILKAAVTGEYPDFDEHALGFKRFSDLLKNLERDGLIDLEFNESRDLLVRIK